MKVNIVGVKDICFTDSKTGREIDGVQLFVSYPMRSVDGLACAKIYLDRRTVNSLSRYPAVDTTLTVDYDMKGRIIGVEN